MVQRKDIEEVLVQNRLVSTSQWSQIPKEVMEGVTDPVAFCDQLRSHGLLTEWQQEAILSGRKRFRVGEYRLVRLLGSGAMGQVYEAWHTTLHRTVAIKLLAANLSADGEAAARFRREVQMAVSVSHPNIVQVQGADRADQQLFMVMEYVPGQTLKSRLADGPLPISLATRFIRQALEGLAHAHEKGLVHRDIKPDNLIVASLPDGTEMVKILDLGLGKFLADARNDQLTRTGVLIGTPDYVAPEQARNAKNADVRSDIYGLGCTYFELLTGQVPFAGRNLLEKLMVRLKQPAPDVRTLRPEVPDDLAEVLGRMLATKPEDRYQTAREVLTALTIGPS